MAAYDPPTAVVPIFDSALFPQEDGDTSVVGTNVNTILATSDNSSGNYYIPFIKTASTGQKSLFIDDATTPITINPSTGDIRMIGLKNDYANYNIALGRNSGAGQGTNVSCIAIGTSTGVTNQSSGGVAMGDSAGQSNQGANAYALGRFAGNSGQGQNSVAIGNTAGQTSQGVSCIAIGVGAGNSQQQQNCVAIGLNAGNSGQVESAVAIGNAAGNSGQKVAAVAIGINAGNNTQGERSVAVGQQAGQFSQGNTSVAIGYNAGNNSQGSNSVSIGVSAAQNGSNTDTIAIGNLAGQATSGTPSTRQGQYAIAIGREAGKNTQGANAIAIGYLAGESSQNTKSIALNASGVALNPNQEGLFIRPIRETTQPTVLGYNTSTYEVGYYTPDPYFAQYINTGNQSLSASTPTDITLATNVIQNGISRTGNVISFNKAGTYKIGASLLVEESGGSATDFYFSFTDNVGVIANSSSVFQIDGNNKKTLAYAEIIYTATASSTIKAVAYTTSSTLSLTSYASPNASIAASPAVIMTIYQIK